MKEITWKAFCLFGLLVTVVKCSPFVCGDLDQCICFTSFVKCTMRNAEDFPVIGDGITDAETLFLEMSKWSGSELSYERLENFRTVIASSAPISLCGEEKFVEKVRSNLDCRKSNSKKLTPQDFTESTDTTSDSTTQNAPTPSVKRNIENEEEVATVIQLAINIAWSIASCVLITCIMVGLHNIYRRINILHLQTEDAPCIVKYIDRQMKCFYWGLRKLFRCVDCQALNSSSLNGKNTFHFTYKN